MNTVQDLRKEISELKMELQECKQVIESMSVPIIESIIPSTVLLPITGKLSEDRLEKLVSAVSSRIFSMNIDTIIIDFSAIGNKEIVEVGIFGEYIVTITNTLTLLGIEALYVGFTPEVALEIIKSEYDTIKGIKTFPTFRTALQHLMKVKGLKFVQE